jgi:CheY-like chemotaxis protein
MTNSAMNDWRVLVVEDLQDGQEIARNLLGYFGIATDLASTAEEALALLDANAYNAAVIDLALPGMDGFELSQIIRSSPLTAHLPCMAVTAYHSSAIRKQVLEVGFDGFYPKPLDYEGFIDELKRIVVNQR